MVEGASAPRSPGSGGEALPGISRPSEVKRLTDLLLQPRPGLSVCAITGPGGVGKSYLLAHVLEATDLAALGTVQVSADGSNPETRGDFFGLLEQLFRRSLGPPADPGKDYFPGLRSVARVHRQLVERAAAELRKQGAPRRLQQGVAALLKAGHVFNALLPRGKDALAVAARTLGPWGAVTAGVAHGALTAAGELTEAEALAALDEAWTAVAGLKSLAASVALPLGPLRRLLRRVDPNRVRRELFQVTAEELVTDLSAAIGGYRGRDVGALTQEAIPGARRLLVVLDDYELLDPLLGDFLVGALVPELARARFDTLLIILCRDDLEATHPGWSQHGKRFLREPLRLQAFDEGTALRLLAAAGIPEDRRPALYQATQGYPFLLSLVIEEASGPDADSALFLLRFYERTTRWLSPREREWFDRVCYLERVDEDTLARLFPADQVRAVQDWFEREPSIRDPTAPFFRVRPLIQEKALRYLALRAPSRHRERLLAAGPRPGP